MRKSGAFYRGFDVEVDSATTTTIVAYVTVSGTTLSSEDLIELIEANLVVAIEEEDDETNFIVTSVEAEISEEPGTGSGNNGNNKTDYTTFLVIGIIFGVLICIVITWFSIDSTIKKRNAQQGNASFLAQNDANATTAGMDNVQSNSYKQINHTTTDTLEVGQSDAGDVQLAQAPVAMALPQQPQVNKSVVTPTGGDDDDNVEAVVQTGSGAGEGEGGKPGQAEPDLPNDN